MSTFDPAETKKKLCEFVKAQTIANISKVQAREACILAQIDWANHEKLIEIADMLLGTK